MWDLIYYAALKGWKWSQFVTRPETIGVKVMAKKDVLKVFKMLARSQGSYGRILNVVGMDGENAPDGFFEQFKDCKDAVDVVMVVEC